MKKFVLIFAAVLLGAAASKAQTAAAEWKAPPDIGVYYSNSAYKQESVQVASQLRYHGWRVEYAGSIGRPQQNISGIYQAEFQVSYFEKRNQKQAEYMCQVVEKLTGKKAVAVYIPIEKDDKDYCDVFSCVEYSIDLGFSD